MTKIAFQVAKVMVRAVITVPLEVNMEVNAIKEATEEAVVEVLVAVAAAALVAAVAVDLEAAAEAVVSEILMAIEAKIEAEIVEVTDKTKSSLITKFTFLASPLTSPKKISTPFSAQSESSRTTKELENPKSGFTREKMANKKAKPL